MEPRIQAQDLSSELQRQAIKEAKTAFSSLPHGDLTFQRCINGKETLAEILETVEQEGQAHKRKKSNRFLGKVQKYTIWLQNISGAVDIAVQTQAGIACPLWAPIKLVLKVSNDNSKATDRIFNLLDTTIECLPRLEIYEKLKSHNVLQVALLHVFTDVVDLAVQAFRFFRRGMIVRLTKVLVHSFDQDIGAIKARLERHARAAHETAVTTELLEAAAFREKAESRQHEESKFQCEAWLKPSNFKSIHQYHVQERLDGTCNWIASNIKFQKWIEPGSFTLTDRLLVISGMHGCGKSVLASSIVVRLNEGQQSTLFFGFSSSDGTRQTSGHLVRTLLWQSLLTTGSQDHVEIIQRLRLAGQPTTSELWEAFMEMNSSLITPVFCIIDGIDECADFDRSMVMKIQQCLETCPNLRIVLLGRPHVIQAHPDHLGISAIEITSEMVYDDIEAFAKSEIAKSSILSTSPFHESIFATLKDKSDGMFLWVRLMADDLNRSSSKFELRERLQKLPCGLEEAYQMIFLRLSQSLNEFERGLVQNTLKMMAVCCRPLHFEDIRYGYGLHCRSLGTNAQPLEEYLILQPPHKIVDIFGGLVSIVDGIVRFVHSSVRDFLIRPGNQWVQISDQGVLDFRIDTVLAHRSFARLCLEYLLLEQEKKENIMPEVAYTALPSSNDHSFLQYAILYTVFHLNRSGPLCPTTLDKITKVIESVEFAFWVEKFTHYLFGDLGLQPQIEEFVIFQERITGAGLGVKLLGSFQQNLKEIILRLRTSQEEEEPRVNQWQLLLELTEEETFMAPIASSSDQTKVSGVLVTEVSRANVSAQASSTKTKTCINDPSTAIPRIMDLLKGPGSLSVCRQIELFLRLGTSLGKLKVAIDPLKALFNLILKKATSLPVYVLVAIGAFYYRLGKYQEALQVYLAASEKIDHLDIPLKFRIYGDIGLCYYLLLMDVEALRYSDKAFWGLERLLGKRHSDTLMALKDLFRCMISLDQVAKVVQLYDELFVEKYFSPEISFGIRLAVLYCRTKCYSLVPDMKNAGRMAECLGSSLKLCLEQNPGDLARNYGKYAVAVARYHPNHDTSLDFYSSAIKRYTERGFRGFSEQEKLRYVLGLQTELAEKFESLGRDQEAKDLLEKTLAEQKTVLPIDHKDLQTTRRRLNRVSFYLECYDVEDVSSEGFSNDNTSQISWLSAPTDRRHQSLNVDNEIAGPAVGSRRYSTTF